MTRTIAANATGLPMPTAVILPFVRPVPKRRDAPCCTAIPPILTRQWADQHLPLIEAALKLLHADDVEFERRCRQIEEHEGREVLETLTSQIAQLGVYIDDVGEALGMTAMRIRTNMAAAG